MFYTYILISEKTNRYYIGCTNNVNSRLIRHNNGYVHSTKAYRPWKLLYSEKFNLLKDARKREKQMKSWKNRSSIEKLVLATLVADHE
ncbi:GIY-YIG nuclease family protein [Candidatus Gottesmanbacteria bacterium]|nr:GIY-YIG nuclease family protein [Candidatus Gottesmanbacteria bacterium]